MNRYKTIYADPPWAEFGGGKIVRGAQRHYPLMRTEEVCRLSVDGVPVKQLAEDNAHLYLWVTNNFMPDGLQVINAWGFRFVTVITWVKGKATAIAGEEFFEPDRFGLGQYFRGITEHMLFAVRGNLPYRTRIVDGKEKRAQGKTLIYSPRGEHSEKPEEARQMIELVSHPPYIELFARKQVPGWTVWGNQANEPSEPEPGSLF